MVVVFGVIGVVALLFAYGPIHLTINIDTNAGGSVDGGDSDSEGSAIAETVRGGNGDNTLNGTIHRDFMSGGGGNDTLNGLGGKDVIQGGEGRDRARGDEGEDLVVGGNGPDILHGDSGNDVVDAYDYSGGDTVDCGPGEGDFVFYNRGDNLKNCENRSARWFVLQDTG